MRKTLYFSVLVFAVLLISVNQEVGIVHLDEDIRQKIQGLWSPDLNQIIISLTDFGAEPSVVISLLLTVIYFGFKRQGGLFRFFLSSLFGCTLLFAILKDLVGRARPASMMVVEQDLSFPSGHASIATVLAWFVYMVFSSKVHPPWKLPFLLICIIYPLLMSFTRVYLNVHYLSDVIAGMALGTAWMIFLSKFYLASEA